MTSGAIQNGVPTNVFRLLRDSVNCPATPKSANLTLPFSDRSTFAATGIKLNKVYNGWQNRQRGAREKLGEVWQHFVSEVFNASVSTFDVSVQLALIV